MCCLGTGLGSSGDGVCLEFVEVLFFIIISGRDGRGLGDDLKNREAVDRGV